MTQNQTSATAKKYAAIAAVTGWTILLLQLYLIILNRKTGIPETVLRYFSYFTILTNILTALSYTAIWLSPANGKLQPLTRTSSLTAVTVYIVMVGIIANTLLLGLLNLSGLTLLVDNFLHIFLPASMLLFWILFVTKTGLKWSNVLGWLWYPAAYVIYLILLGVLTGFYPYPFANVTKLGYSQALLNGVYITSAFAILSLLFVAISKAVEKKSAFRKQVV